MLTQKLYRNGNSVAVTIPKEYLEELNLKEGSEVVVIHDENDQTITIQPKMKEQKSKSSLNPKFFKWLEGFNKQYGPALRELAKR